MVRLVLALLLLLQVGGLLAQADSTLQVQAWVDVYYGLSSAADQGQRPYQYASATDRALLPNVVAVQLRSQRAHYRLQLTPALGTYMLRNYAAEPEGLRYLMDAYAGVRLRGRWWLDAGVLPSPFGMEGALSHELPTYTRSQSAEQSPYYLAGARLLHQTDGHVLQLGVVNGWQQLVPTVGSPPAVVAQLQLTPDSLWCFNWSVYAGPAPQADTVGQAPPTRAFSNLYGVWRPSKRWEVVALWDVGLQAGQDNRWRSWHTGHLIGAVRWAKHWRSHLRAEYYADVDGVNQGNVVDGGGLTLMGGSVGADWQARPQATLRAEVRYLEGTRAVFPQPTGPVRGQWTATLALSVWLP